MSSTRNLLALTVAFAIATSLALTGIVAIHSEDAPAADAPASAAETIQAMSWIAGTWSGAMWGGTFEAYYTTPEGGRIISHSRLLKEGKESFYEFEVFSVVDDVVNLQPFPGGKRANGFKLASHDAKARRAVFENPAKDYPTRITYELAADDNLVITLEDPHGKSEKTERFDLKR